MDQRIKDAATEMFRTVVEGYKTLYRGDRVTVDPTMFLVRLTDDDDLPVVQEVPSAITGMFFEEANKTGREQCMQMIRMMLEGDPRLPIPWGDKAEGPAAAAFLIIEGYTKAVKSEKDLDDYQHGDLALDPASGEAVMLQVHTLGGTMLLIQKIKAGELIGEIEVVGEVKPDEVKGRMAMQEANRRVVH